MLLKLLRTQKLSIMQQFGASALYTVVRCHKLCELNNEYILHISIVLAICIPKINYQILLRFDEVLTNNLGHFLAHPV